MAKVVKRKFTKDEANVGETRSTTIRGLAKDKHFNRGYADKIRGVWTKEYDTWPINAQWQYERGRHYAAAGGPQIKCETDGRVLRTNALWFMVEMLNSKAMI